MFGNMDQVILEAPTVDTVQLKCFGRAKFSKVPKLWLGREVVCFKAVKSGYCANMI